MNLRAVVLAACLAVPGLAQAQQFDLECRGEVRSAPQGRPVAYTERYRIDLDARRWCVGTCSSPASIFEVTPDRITFAAPEAGPPASGSTSFLYASRTSGELVNFTYTPAISFYYDAKAVCAAAPFSGMPAPKF